MSQTRTTGMVTRGGDCSGSVDPKNAYARAAHPVGITIGDRL